MVQEKLPLPEPQPAPAWAEEAGSRVRASWRVAPPLPEITGYAFVRALLRFGWSLEEQDDSQCRVTQDGREIVVPRGRLDPAVVPFLAMAAGLGPLTLISALEQSLRTELQQEFCPTTR